MSFFTSIREKRLWLGALLILLAIFSTLFVGRPLAKAFQSQDLQAAVFLLCMSLVGFAILIHAVIAKPTIIEVAVILGITAVYILLLLRLGLAERSHLIEYSILAIFIHKAILERIKQGKNIRFPALLSLVITFLISLIDECIQIFLPDRVYDPVDILFNSIVITAALGFYMLLAWVRKLRKKK